jgi:hypothetical protein
MKAMDNEGFNFPTLLAVTVSGAIYVIASIPQPLFAQLYKVQEKMSNFIKGVGAFKHAE